MESFSHEAYNSKPRLPSYLERYTSIIGISHIVELRAYDPAFEEIFSQECSRLMQAFGGISISLEHVGSTSIEGLCAKPIIDILLSYDNTIGFEQIKTTLMAAGYTFREDLLPDRTYFVLENEDGVRYGSLSVFREGDIGAEGILRFRDRLRNDSELRDEYADLKQKLFSETTDRKAYTAKKAAFVEQHSK